jgi:hypothetical protein
MGEAKALDETHFEVFTNAEHGLQLRGPYCTASVTRACTQGDFKTHRGVHLNLQMEDLEDAVTERGRDAVIQEIGLIVCALLDTAVKEEKNAGDQG